MGDQLEYAARALAERNMPGTVRGDDARKAWVDHQWPHYVPDVRAVVNALYEPTEQQVDRFVSRALCASVAGDGGWSEYARCQWRTMIDALLSTRSAAEIQRLRKEGE